jgi:glutathione synthase/RimK-type ligase-like ATP-grasp enzyme
MLRRFLVQLAIITDSKHPLLSEDDRVLLPLLAHTGITGVPVDWEQPVDLEQFRGLLIRSPWNYFEKSHVFIQWLESIELLGLPVWNSLKTLKWNLNKRYLEQLEVLGVRTVPTRWVDAGELRFERFPWSDIVVKPTVSGGGFSTWRVRAGATMPELEAKMPLMVQPYLKGIQAGELSLVFIGGNFSHAVRKLPSAGGFLIHEEYGGRTQPEKPSAELIEEAGWILKTASRLLGEEFLYARVDGVMEGCRFYLMELELLEPALYFAHAPGSAEAFVQALINRLAG